MKKYFLAGLATLLPFTLTLWIVIFAINFFTHPFQGSVEKLLKRYAFFNHSFLFLSPEQVLILISKGLVLLALLAFILWIGLLGRMMILKTLFRFGDYILHRIPFINKIYKATQEGVKTVFSTESSSFSQVALVPFPHAKAYSIGLLTKAPAADNSNAKISVFVPATPNPTTGFMLSYKAEEIILIDMKVEDALKFVLSCGIMFPGFQSAAQHPHERSSHA